MAVLAAPAGERASPCIPGQYRARRAAALPLVLLLRERFAEFKAVYPERFEADYGPWRPVVEEVVEKFLDCGDPHQGFARARCPDCGHEILLPHSCKCRGFCASCHQRKVLVLGDFLEREILKPVPHRHWIWALPRVIRRVFLKRRDLIPTLTNLAWQSLLETAQEAVERDDLFPGAILAPQSFGNLANGNLHIHGLATDVLFDREGNIHPLPKLDPSVVRRVFEAKVYALLVEEHGISPSFVEKMRAWRHSGFSVNSETRVGGDDSRGRRTLAEYIARAPFALDRMEINLDAGLVLYRTGKACPEGVPANFETLDLLSWIARITSHIPEKGVKTIVYYGAYSQAWRGRERKKDIVPGQPAYLEPSEDDDYTKARRLRWAALIRRVWAVDPLLCPKCGGTMKIISFIRDSAVIEKILRHLGLWDPPTRAPPPAVPTGAWGAPAAEEADPGWFPDPAWQDDIPVVAGA